MTGASSFPEIVSEVRSALSRSQAFRGLPHGQQAQIEADLAKVTDFITKPASAVAKGLEDKQPSATDVLKMNAAKDPGLVQDQFKATAVHEGTEAFRDMVGAVDFPKFVASLVQGVFRAIVEASIQQMQAFSDLLQATAKSVDQFASENITDSQARDYVANRHPEYVKIDTTGDRARLRPAGDDMGDMGKEYGMSDVDLTDDDNEQQLVMSAKTQMARSRQQSLATMVLMGINRIVVTNGHINAKVVFDMRASDDAKRRRKAEMSDSEKDHEQSQTGWFTNLVGGYDVSHDHETTVKSSVDETSEAKAEVKANLTGEVKIDFKSETFPLERMVDLIGMQNLQDKAQPGSPRPLPAPAAAAGRRTGTRNRRYAMTQELGRIDHVRQLVRGLLQDTESFDGLDDRNRKLVAKSLVTILDYLTDGKGGSSQPIASAQAEKDDFAANKGLQDKLVKGSPTASQDFSGGAANALGKTFKEIVGDVDFPKFVSSLIDGVFTSIVKSTIAQMEAFAKMLESVAKSADQFAKETISRSDRASVPAAVLSEFAADGRLRRRRRRAAQAQGRPRRQGRPELPAGSGASEPASLDDKEGEAKMHPRRAAQDGAPAQQHLAR